MRIPAQFPLLQRGVKKTKKTKSTKKTTKARKVVAKTRKAVKTKAARTSSRAPKRNSSELSPEADKFLADALAEFNAKQEALKRDWGFGSFERWVFDPPTKLFTLHFADGTQFEADGQILGTYCPSDGSWEWAWNNPNVEAAIAVPADKLKEVGSSLGISYLTAGKVPTPTRDFANYLCAIGLKVTGAEGVYLGGEPPVEAAIVLFNPRRKLKAA